MLKKLGLMITLGTVSLAGCSSRAPDSFVNEVAEKMDIKEKEKIAEIETIADAYYRYSSSDMRTNASLERAIMDAYRKGCVEKGLPAEVLTKAIKYSQRVSGKTESIDMIQHFTSKIIDLSAEYRVIDIFNLLKELDANIGEHEPSSYFADSITHILKKCKEHDIKIRDFSRLVKMVSNLGNRKSESVNDYAYLADITSASVKVLGVDIQTMLGIASSIDEQCGTFNRNTESEISDGLFHFAQLYNQSGMTRSEFLSKLEEIANSNDCNEINEFVEMMKEKTEHERGKKLKLQKIDQVLNAMKNPEMPIQVRADRPEFSLEDYQPIALEQKNIFNGETVRITAIPVAYTTVNDTYVVKLMDDNKILDCVYYIGKSLEAALMQNDVQFVMKLNENADTKKKITVYGRLIDNLLYLDIVNTGKETRRLR